MSVSSCTKSWHGANGSRSGTEGQSANSEYSAGWVVKTTTVLDGPEVIFRYCQTNADGRPYLGMEYRFGNDTDVSCFCNKITPRRDAKVGTLWEVVAEFAPKSGSGNQATAPSNDGTETTDPLQWAPKVTVRPASISAPVDKAKFLGGMKGSALAHWPVGKEGPVVNSARVPFDPPLEYERDIEVVSFTFYAPHYAGKFWRGIRGALNTNTQTFQNNWMNYHDTWEPFTAKIRGADASFNYQNKIKYYEMTVEVHIDPLGWDRHILDQGKTTDCHPDRADDDRTPSIGDLLAIPEVVPTRTVKSLDGIPVDVAVPFDGNGWPLANPTPDNRVYLDYRVYLNERDFGPIFNLFINQGSIEIPLS